MRHSEQQEQAAVSLVDLQRELSNLKQRYGRELDSLTERAVESKRDLTDHGIVSNHGPFNMSATCQNLAVLAGKIEQTANVIRWMGEAK